MMGEKDPQLELYYNLSLEGFVPNDHPLRRIRPLVNDEAIRKHCRELYSPIGRPSIPPEQLFLALLAGYVMGITSERRLVMELQCNMALRWFVGLNLSQDAWDHSTFSQNRRRRFDRDGTMQWLFDQTIKKALEEGLVSRHVSADGTLVRANASYKSFVPIELTMEPEEYRRKLRSEDPATRDDEPQDPGNRAVNFRGEKRSNRTHRSTSDPDCRFVSKGSTGTGAFPGYTVNGVMDNRNRILLGIAEEIFSGSTGEERGCLSILKRVKRKFGFKVESLGADKGYFHEAFLDELLEQGIEPHVAVKDDGSSDAHSRVRMRQRGEGYRLSQRCRKKIEELWGEGKDWHGLRRLRRRCRHRIREELCLIGWVLNLKRLAKILAPRLQAA
jgi:transposase